MEEFQEGDEWGPLHPFPIKIPKRNKSASVEIPRSSSMPAYVPDWNNVQKKEKWCNESDKEDDACNGEGDEGGDDDEGKWIPPHELLARRMRRSNRAAYSMCEGVGRTLKGRDLIDVRNAVFVRTGFLKMEDLIKAKR